MKKIYTMPEFEVTQLTVKDILNDSFDDVRNEVLVNGNGLFKP